MWKPLLAVKIACAKYPGKHADKSYGYGEIESQLYDDTLRLLLCFDL
jgi:hypothetical protein